MANATDIIVPSEQEGTKAIVRAWLKQIGDRVEENDPLVELETDKVTLEVPSPAAGVLTEIILDTDAEALPGAVLGRLGEPSHETGPASDEELPPTPSTATSAAAAPNARQAIMVLSPAVRRALLHHRIDPVEITGTGRGGRITRADVDAFVARGKSVEASPSTPPAAAAPAAPSRSASDPDSGGVCTLPHDRMRLAIAANMLGSVTAAPHVTAVFECDFTAIIAHRRRHKAAFERDGANLTFTAYFIAACVAAMKAQPAINSRWFEDRMELYDDVSIGIGTALGEKGLVVPVVHRAQELALLGIATRLTDLVARARDGKLAPADMRGGTFTISNHGVSGSLMAAPIIINQPQSAILGIGKTEKRVVVREIDAADTIQIRPIAYVSLTIDHRVVDGHQTNGWLSTFVETIENWPS